MPALWYQVFWGKSGRTAQSNPPCLLWLSMDWADCCGVVSQKLPITSKVAFFFFLLKPLHPPTMWPQRSLLRSSHFNGHKWKKRVIVKSIVQFKVYSEELWLLHEKSLWSLKAGSRCYEHDTCLLSSNAPSCLFLITLSLTRLPGNVGKSRHIQTNKTGCFPIGLHNDPWKTQFLELWQF